MSEVKGGTKLANALAEISANLEKVGTLRVGFLSGARYPNGTPVALIAAIHNYGAPRAKIPARPYFSNMIVAKSPDWPAAIARLLKANNYDTAKVLALAGEAIKGQLQQAIRDFDSVPLKPATIKKKGFDKQLIDKGIMLNAVAYEVK